ncbi:MAG TPA: GNAT family N-acetyltransferase [Candidatus Acidoferrales bacterium]|nr:GNAT family N-acetyltransferase [Candidatus Acidoferrales bacterium]
MVEASSDIEISDIRDDAERQRFAEIDAQSFAGNAADNMRWLKAAEPHTTLRLARIGGEVVGGYIMLPTGEFFGGRSVPAQGISAVVVDAAWRRRGVAGALMRDCVAAARDSGAAVAPLFAATVRLYRRWGWEVCTQTFRQIVHTRSLSGFRGEGTVRANPDRASVEALRRTQLLRWDGPLDRPDWWLSVEWDPGNPSGNKGEYGWYEGDQLTGYVRYDSDRAPGMWIRVRVQELVYATTDALRGLLGFLGGQESQSREVVFQHSALPDLSPLHLLLAEPHRDVEVGSFIPWMQRIVHIERAMSARGWAATAGRVALEVTDPVLGVERVVLEVEDGTGRVTKGGDGRVRCGIGALSAWYSSALRARDAALLGLIDGDTEALIAMDGLVAGGVPWIPDFF